MLVERRILRTPEVLELTAISRTTLWRRVRSGDFPPPLKLGGPDSKAVGWRRDDVEAWLDSRPSAA
ncbi:helix-turn-helix transcriptional regulator [Candidatus Palauibacter sp.]|uniref:helix-turn-helix transcriptional regulator n=1 Tax=Candidatus Palauibacter sp. TaxID=3101350 RepID=UPI003AF24B24